MIAICTITDANNPQPSLPRILKASTVLSDRMMLAAPTTAHSKRAKPHSRVQNVKLQRVARSVGRRHSSPRQREIAEDPPSAKNDSLTRTDDSRREHELLQQLDQSEQLDMHTCSCIPGYICVCAHAGISPIRSSVRARVNPNSWR